jgi:REP element-mobilizing transposase RayT
MLQHKSNDVFVTWRLKGTLPRKRFAPPSDLTPSQSFAWIDRLLDSATCGPSWLRRPDVAETVVQALHYGESELRHYALHAYVVMPNHVHMLITPGVALPKILDSLKTSTAEIANRLLERGALPFWDAESYDYWIQETEFEEICRYIERNPVKAALADEPCLYPWSSASRRRSGLTVRFAGMASATSN